MLCLMRYLSTASFLHHQVDAKPLTATADSGNEELVHWLADECGVTPVYTKVGP